MSHLYPLAPSARAALSKDCAAARTRAEAKVQAGRQPLGGLRSEWLTLSAEESLALSSAIERGVEAGFIQRYEDQKGNTVIALTYWALGQPPAEPPTSPARPGVDHTDDLYFRNGRTRKRRRQGDPNQLDLFDDTSTPD